MTRRDVEIVAEMMLKLLAAAELAKRSGPSFDFNRAVDDAIEQAAAQTEP